jgi:Superfamily I DNA and RNA helicases and helicase subunits
MSIYDALGVVARTDGVPRVDVGIDDPVAVGQDAYERARDELRVMEHFATEIDTFHTHPWGSIGAEIWEIDMGATAEASLSTMREACEGLIAAIDPIAGDLGVSIDTLEDVHVLEATLQLLGERPDIAWTAIIFDPKTAGKRKGLGKLRNLDKRIGQLRDQLTSRYARTFLEEDATALADRLAEFGALRAINREFRELRRKIHRHAVGGYAPNHAAMVEDVRDLEKLQRYERDRQQLTPVIEGLGELYQDGHTDWEAIAEARGWAGELRELPEWIAEPIQRGLLDDGLAEVPDGADLREAIQDFEGAYDELRRRFEMDALEIDGTAVDSQSLGLVADRLDALRSQIPALQQRVEFNQQRRRVGQTVAAGYFERFLEEEQPAEHLVASFERGFFTRWSNHLYPDTAFMDFSEEEYRRLITDFREADVLHRQIAREGVIQRVLANRHGLRDAGGDSDAALLVRREIQKQRRHTPLRELIEEAGGYITELTPCLMMSPLSVAQFLPADAVEFDVVIFDEASQVQPQDAISALIRAEQAIIAGDSKQLPPTTFFDVDVETAEDVREDLDSILEELNVVLPQHRLRWHYRSRTNELIDFSNDRYYGNSLLTFPENDGSTATGVEYIYVEDGLYDRGGSRQNIPEARQVVALIAEHAATAPEKSLGVVAFSSAQEQAIRDVLEQRQNDDPDLRRFVRREDVLDEFFIKNLEMVQGDERDRMIFSIGYGPDRHGKITMNFGPMNQSGGERRLNVAITRAREAVTVVTSIDPDDIDLRRTTADGVEDLKRYLQYARDGPVVLQRDVEVDETLQFDSDFEEAVYTALTAEGYDVASQVGTANYSIDLAIRDPDHPGRFLLGIECDGAAYHASKTARDRDRTRQAVLESLGWTIHRIWSPDWASNPQSEIERIDAVVEQIQEGDTPAPTAMPVVDPLGTTTVPVDELEPGARLTADDAAAEMPIRFTTYVEPAVSRTDRHDPEALGTEQAAMNSLEDVVLRGGPIIREEAYRQAMRLWEYERLDDEVRQIFDGLLSKLQAADLVFVHGDALYPAGDAITPEVRCHDGDDTREITKVPETELMLAVVGVLAEVGDVPPEELIETTTERLGYARVGARIDRTLRAVIERLQSMDLLVADGGELRLVASAEASVDVIVDDLR